MSSKTINDVLEDVSVQKQICEWENVLTANLLNLAKALSIASDRRMMSLEHAKTIWKSYLSLSGMDIPKDLKEKVTTIIEKKSSN